VDPKRLSSIASALASETRAGIVTALMDGTAHTGLELARHLGVAPSTASEHLGVLVDAGFVAVEAQGRHRYFRLASTDVAAFVEATVTLDAALDPTPVAPPRADTGLLFARSCYDHLAGELGVLVYERLVDIDAIHPTRDGISLTPTGRDLCARLDIPLDDAPRPLVRACLDWTERRHHLAGIVGAGLLTAMLDRDWVRRQPQPRRRRELRLTPAGETALATHLGLELP